MTIKIFSGLFLFIFSFLLNYGGMALSGYFAVNLDNPEIAYFGVPGFYGLSWVVWFLGLYLMGKANYEYFKYATVKYLNGKYLSQEDLSQ